MKTKKVLGCALALALVASLTTPIQAAENGWKMSGGGVWNYTNVDGTLAKGWQTIDGCWYAFETDGSMKTGWIASDEKWYFMGESGIMQDTGWVNYEGADYYLKGTGVMATDYFKEGYELDSTGKAIPMTQTKSVELTEQMDINNKTIEGNLYLDATKFKELELSGITVTGKLVIMGEEVPDAKITIKDSTVNTISSQARGAAITLAGTTTVKSIQIEENSAIKPGEDYTGKVESIEIQSTAQKEVKIEVPAQSVTSNTFAPVTVEAKVDNLAVNKKTELTVNDDIKNIIVNNTATDTKVEVGKGSTVGSIASDTKVEVGGDGKVEHIDGENITNDTKPPRPSGEDRPTPPVTPDGIGVSTEADLKAKLADETVKKIYLESNIKLENSIDIVEGRDLVFDLNGKEITVKKTGERSLYAFNNSGELTINDSSKDKAGHIIARGVQNLNDGILTINGGTIVACDTNGGAAIWNEATLYVNGGQFKTQHIGTPNDQYGISCLNNLDTVYITGGTFTNVNRRSYAIISTKHIEITPASGKEVNIAGAHGGLGVDAGTAIINGGSYSSTEYYGLYVSNDAVINDPNEAVVTVNDGVFNGARVSVWIGSDVKDTVNSSILIIGGKFEKKLHAEKNTTAKAIQVKGGLFIELEDKYVAEGYEKVAENGYFKVIEKTSEDPIILTN